MFLPQKQSAHFAPNRRRKQPLTPRRAPPEQQSAPWQQPPPGYPGTGWSPSAGSGLATAPNSGTPAAATAICAADQQAPPPPQYAATQYPPQQQYVPPPPPPQQYAPPQQQTPYAPPPAPPAAWQPTPTQSGPPTWMVAIGFAVVLLLVGGGIYYFFLRTPGSSSAEKAGLENPANASQQKVTNPLQKYVEVVGMRLINEDKRPVAKFVVVNHSSAEIDGLEANVRLWASTSRSEEDSVGSFSFKLPEIAANSSKDLTEPLKTKLKIYELPDWQNTTAEIEITSPAAP